MVTALATRAAPLAALLSARGRRALGAGLAALAVGYVLYLIYAGFGLVDHPTIRSVMGDWVYLSMLAASALLCLARAWLVRAGRAPWLALGVGMGAWVLGMSYWMLVLRHLESPPYPSLAEALYLSLYPAVYVALGLLARDRIERFARSVWLDGLAGGLTAAGLAAALIFPPIIDTTGASAAAVAVNLAYPVGDLLLIAFLVGLYAATGWAPGRPLLLIGAGLAVFTVADTIYLQQVATGTFEEGGMLDALWPIGLGLFAIAAWQPLRERSPTELGSRAVLLFPSLFILVSLGVLVYGNLRPLNAVALTAAAAALIIAALRTGLTFADLRALVESESLGRTDELTGLANRRFFTHSARRLLAECERDGRPATLVLADLDGFKDLNDTLGHHAGDRLLKEVGERLRRGTGKEELVGRLGGDEFAVLAPGVGAARAQALAARVRSALERPFGVEEILVHVEASLGMAVSPDHGDDADTLLQHADVAMYAAKASHSRVVLYDHTHNRHSRERLGLLGELSRALDAGELAVHYQPKHRLSDGVVVGVEALLRWRHPQRGMLMPSAFLPASHRTGLMRPLQLLALEQALAECRHWRRLAPDLTVAVNISLPAIVDPRLMQDVERLLASSQLEPGQLVLEVTEDAVMGDPLRTTRVMADLASLGIELALDDFGMGQSSLNHLKWLPLHELKLDRSFVSAMDSVAKDAAIVETTVSLGHRLGLRVVAEGVERPSTLDRLRQCGCDLAQGFHLSYPMPPAELERWLGDRIADPSSADRRFLPERGGRHPVAAERADGR